MLAIVNVFLWSCGVPNQSNNLNLPAAEPLTSPEIEPAHEGSIVSKNNGSNNSDSVAAFMTSSPLAIASSNKGKTLSVSQCSVTVISSRVLHTTRTSVERYASNTKPFLYFTQTNGNINQQIQSALNGKSFSTDLRYASSVTVGPETGTTLSSSVSTTNPYRIDFNQACDDTLTGPAANRITRYNKPIGCNLTAIIFPKQKYQTGPFQAPSTVQSGNTLPITLPSSDTDSTALDNRTYGPPSTLDIYGYFSNATNVVTRRKVTAPIPAYLPRLAHTSLYGAVAGGSTTVFCPGDDGGPVIATTINGTKTLAGVVVAPDGVKLVVSANTNMRPQFIINNVTGCSNYAIYATFAGSGIRAFLDSIKNLGN